MKIVCLDLEGVLVPEMWIAFAEAVNIPEFRITTRDEPDYDKLMKFRIALLEERGCTEGYFVCGGSSMVFLAKPDGSGYTVAAGNPRSLSAEPYAQLTADRTTLSTSSDESHSYRCGDILCCHIIDPGTGYPLNYPAEGEVQRGTASVTLLGESAAAGDALSTALCLMGPEAALRFLAGREEKMVMAVCKNGEMQTEVVSNLPREAVTLAAEGCRWACEEEGGSLTYSGEWAR